MNDLGDDPPASSPDAAPSEPRPSGHGAPHADAPDDGGPQVPRAVVEAFLSLQTTRDRIRQVVVRRLGEDATDAAIDDVVQLASVKAFTAKRLAGAADKLRPWVSAIAAHAAIDWLRREAARPEVFLEDLASEELPPDPIDVPDDVPGEAEEGAQWIEGPDGEPATADRYMMGPWIEAEIGKRKNNESDLLMLEMLRYKANHAGMTDAQVAEIFGMTLAKYESRFRRFRLRYKPIRGRYLEKRRTILLLVVLGLAVAALIAVLLWRPRVALIGPDDAVVPRLIPTPSVPAPAPAPAPSFDQALPPRREKP